MKNKIGRPAVDNDRAAKYCPICSKTKARDQFAEKVTPDGMHSTCKVCSSLEVSIASLKRRTVEELAAIERKHQRQVLRIQRIKTGRYTTRELAKIEASEVA